MELRVRNSLKDEHFVVVVGENGGHGQRLVGLQETGAQLARRSNFDGGGNGHHELSAATETYKRDGYLTDRAPNLMGRRKLEQGNSRSGGHAIEEDPVKAKEQRPCASTTSWQSHG